MVTRKTRNYKEQKPISAFGRIVLPVSAVLALALLYFSVKLFFFAPSSEIRAGKPYSETEGQHTTLPRQDETQRAAEPDLPSWDDMQDTETVVPVQNEPDTKEPAKKGQDPESKPASVPKPKTKEPDKKTQPIGPAIKKADKPAEVKPRWDVQIGGFYARQGADVTIKQAKDAGFSPYVVEAKLDGKPFYKVRVRGYAGKQETQNLSSKLEKIGFPVYLVEIK